MFYSLAVIVTVVAGTTVSIIHAFNIIDDICPKSVTKTVS